MRRERVGERIREARKEAGLSHDALVAKVGSSRQHLIKLEHGMHLPSEALLDRIAVATSKPVAYFERDDVGATLVERRPRTTSREADGLVAQIGA